MYFLCNVLKKSNNFSTKEGIVEGLFFLSAKKVDTFLMTRTDDAILDFTGTLNHAYRLGADRRSSTLNFLRIIFTTNSKQNDIQQTRIIPYN